jgi:dienelactone hydrolase
MTRRALALAVACSSLATIARAQDPSAAIWKQRVSFKSGNLTLVGFVFKPAGPGPFPTVVWNHGSEKNPGTMVQFDSVAGIFVPAGYVVFAPMRRGHGFSEGKYVVDSTAAVRAAKGPDAAAKLVVRLMESEQLDDQLAGLAFVKQLAYVDTSRLAVAGCSYGGIQTLLAAERGAGYKAAIAISPAALSWEGNKYLQDRLKAASRKISMPTMLLQPPKDASLGPSKVLGAELKHLGAQFTGKVYPATGPEAEQQHCFGGAKGMHIWGADAVAFLKRAGIGH